MGILLYCLTAQTVKAQIRGNEEVITCPDTANLIKGIFDIPELKIFPSPESDGGITFPTSEKVIDYDIEPTGVNVAIVVIDKSGNSYLKFWQIGKSKISDSLLLTMGFVPKSIICHPKVEAFFVMGVKDFKNQILRIQKSRNKWISKIIFSTPTHLRRLVICPCPFITSTDYMNDKYYYSYRLFFGMENADKSYRIVSVTENGNKLYQVIGPAKTFTKPAEDDVPPSEMESDWALPIAFHPAGHQLIWQDKFNRFNYASYQSKSWGETKPMKLALSSHGTITPTPNGLGLIHWQNDKKGIGVYLLASKKENIQLPDYHFIAPPSSTPDGKGIIGLMFSNNQFTLNYLHINVPLADVTNAWMYVNSENESDLFQKNSGLFRPNQDDQLYQLYDSENYLNDASAPNNPVRPYLVTTDIFWELFGAAYEGIFIVKERDEAIPDFWKFISAAQQFEVKSNSKSKWKEVFTVLQDFNAGNIQNPEVKKIINEINDLSDITQKQYPYSDLKPRGHYTSSPEMEKYFKAFRYFTTILKSSRDTLKELNLLPKEVSVYAEKWIQSYNGFVAPSRSPLVWKDIKVTAPKYCMEPQKDSTIFPLSWGFDNEVLNSTVYHEKAPVNLQIKFRLLPSGLDFASVLGNSFADKLLESDYAKYPNLHKVIENLRNNYIVNNKLTFNKENLYESWLNAIAVQWADTLKSPNRLNDRDIWQTKRLQTGLATWSTLRHASVLVNERTCAECGEGGFEEILMRAPRGYVEPDPNTFAAIAGLFEMAVHYVSRNVEGKPNITDQYDDDENAAKISLYDGIVGRLKEVAGKARYFQTLAEKEIRGEALSNEENKEILFVARIAEHNFLIFNSLSNKDYALSNPDPIAKITDIAGGGFIPYLMSAVGKSMEWNHIVPYFGRHQIVKGSIYSYYEFVSKQLSNDKEWQKKVTKQEFLPWIKPYITDQKAEGLAETHY
ncbi:MAG: DUF3160 domain-containing protein [Bacteroidota bacterium]|nr:DUF3160 domain-containing protein [Bacteroidota bacterium]